MYYVVSLSEVTPARLMYYQVFAKTIDTIQELAYALCNGLWYIKGDSVFTAFSYLFV